MAAPTLTYSKPALDVAGQLKHLQGKGLIVHDVDLAELWLKRLGYNRLLIYTRPLQDTHKKFLPGKSFDDVIYLYEFDRQLRLLCMDAIERIEVALRAALSNALSNAHGPHFYGEVNHYNSLPEMLSFLGHYGRAKSIAIDHYKSTYHTPAHPPIWALLEAVSYGNLSRLFSSLTLPNRKIVAAELGFNETILTSWLRSINLVRNICAHHGRLWNRSLVVDTPKKANQLAYAWPTIRHPQRTFAARALIMAALLSRIEPDSDWRCRMRDLVSSRTSIDPAVMGFSPDWTKQPIWN